MLLGMSGDSSKLVSLGMTRGSSQQRQRGEVLIQALQSRDCLQEPGASGGPFVRCFRSTRLVSSAKLKSPHDANESPRQLTP